MAIDAFSVAWGYTFGNEGGYVNNPLDKGGPTNYGITMRTLTQWRAPKQVTIEDVQALTINEAQDIYRSKYWLVMSCDRVESLPISVALFDISVWAGVHSAAMYAQMSINHCLEAAQTVIRVTEDGVMGPSAISAINRVPPDPFIAKYSDLLLARQDHIIEIDPSQNIFRRGWTNRLKRLLTLRQTAVAGGALV